MGAHVWGPAYLRDHLLPQGRVTGWAPSWYAGFPAYTFYFPLAALLIVLLDLFLPYGVAFKLVAVMGAVTLPVAAYAFGRLSRLRFPGPPLLAVATLPFLFDTSFTIYGGNIASLLAGEFSFSLSLSLALLFLGVLSRGMETGEHRALAAVLLALTALGHLIPTVFAVGAAGVLLVLRFDRRRFRYFATVALLAFMIAAFWALPLLARLSFTNDMGWGKITEYSKTLFPPHMKWILPLVGAGIISAIGLRVYSSMAIGAIGGFAGIAFVLLPEGRLWNARLLPFWFLCLYLLAGVGVAEVGRAAGGMFTRDTDRPAPWPAPVTSVVALVFTIIAVGGPLRALPEWLPMRSGQVSFVPDWIRWNFSGYEAKASYPEYHSLMETMRSLPCGRAMWEYQSEHNRYGTPMALMLLPYWTNECIASMEGLHFEASATTPFHFINASELSKQPSNPQRDLPYGSLDLASGVRHLQLMGVRYYMAISAEAISQAIARHELRLVAESGPWKIFEVGNADLVVPLSSEPVVVEGIGNGQKEWLPLALSFYMNPSRSNVFLTRDGPSEWTRIDRGDRVPKRSVRKAVVRNIRADRNSVSFDVDRPGSPVLVKVSYFPNWKVRGGRGPWRTTPNFMLVVPTERHVELVYGYTTVDVAAWLLTILGIVILIRIARRPVQFRERVPELPRPEIATSDRELVTVPFQALSGSVGTPWISVVMPAHNEGQILESSVRRVVKGLRARNLSFEVLIVENGSRDGTLRIARDLSADFPEVHFASLLVADYGGAIREGVLAAVGDYVVIFDVDNCDLGFFDRARSLLERSEDAAIVVGTKRGPGALDKRSWPRRVMTAVFSMLLRFGLGLRVSDTHGMKAMRRDQVLELARQCRFREDLFDAELILRAERSGLRVLEIPISVEERRSPRTSIFGRIPRTLAGLLRLRFQLLREVKPAQKFEKQHSRGQRRLG